MMMEEKTEGSFQHRNRRYSFTTGKLDVKCNSLIKRFTITDFDRHRPTSTTVIATDTYDCFYLAEKQFDFFMKKQQVQKCV